MADWIAESSECSAAVDTQFTQHSVLDWLSDASLAPISPPPVPRPIRRRAPWVRTTEAVLYKRANVLFMQQADRQALRDALTELNQPTNRRWGRYVYLHKLLTLEIHSLQGRVEHRFLPWHRVMLWQFEQEIRGTGAARARIRAGGQVYIPNWSWTMPDRGIRAEWLDFHPDILLPDVNGPELADVRALRTTFSSVDREIGNVQASPVVVTRGPRPELGRGDPYVDTTGDTQTLPLQSSINTIQGKTDFVDYMGDFEGEHALPHNYVGGGCTAKNSAGRCIAVAGPMANIRISPSDIMFWMHHAHCDRLWLNWQRVRPSDRMHPSGSQIPRPSSPQNPPWSQTVADVLDPTGTLGYDYA